MGPKNTVYGEQMEDRIAAFVKKADEVTAEYWGQQGYTHVPPPIHRAC